MSKFPAASIFAICQAIDSSVCGCLFDGVQIQNKVHGVDTFMTENKACMESTRYIHFSDRKSNSAITAVS